MKIYTFFIFMIHRLSNQNKNCKITKGEEKITEWLKSNNVKYIFQHTFKDCKYKQVLFFDFYF